MSPLNLLLLGFIVGVSLGLSAPIIGTFTTYITNKLGKRTSKNAIAGIGLLTLLYLVMVLVLASLIITYIVELFTTNYQEALLVSVPIVAIVLGLSLIRRYFWHEPLIKLQHTKDFAWYQSVKSTRILQPLYVAVALFYTILPSFIVSALSLSLLTVLMNELSLFWVFPLAIGTITPVYVVLVLLSTNTKASKIILWMNKTKATMYLYNGLLLILLAWVLLYTTIQKGGL
jgi:MFS family permease